MSGVSSADGSDWDMSVSGAAARRDVWVRRIERCPAAGIAIGERCSLNKVNKSSLYKRFVVFRDEGRPLRRKELGDVRMGEGDVRRHRRCQGHHA